MACQVYQIFIIMLSGFTNINLIIYLFIGLVIEKALNSKWCRPTVAEGGLNTSTLVEGRMLICFRFYIDDYYLFSKKWHVKKIKC